MRVGDYVTIDEIKQQDGCRWVVLTDFVDGKYGGLIGGLIRFIADTKSEAGEVAARLNLGGTDATLVCGSLDELVVGGVLVE